MGRDVAQNRLPKEDYAAVTAELHPPLDRREALVEAGRCYFCHDAPCTRACPTEIDIPMFIRQIQTADVRGAAKTIFDENILGGMCARVCPTEQLCEEACVRVSEDQPVKIGLLQRYATDHLTDKGDMPFTRAPSSGKKICVVGAGPAGLACAHRLAVHGHEVDILDARPKSGGLNEYGIASYKTPGNFAQREIDYVLSIGGVTAHHGVRLGADRTIQSLRDEYDAVFLALGMGVAGALGVDGEDSDGVIDAIAYIADLRQADDLASLAVGRRVVVVGGGMTAVDIAVQIRRLGAEDVSIVYRRGPDQMKASDYECGLAKTSGVTIRHWAQPSRVIAEGGDLRAIEFEKTRLDGEGRLSGTGETFTIEADIVFKAVGQKLDSAGVEGETVKLRGGRLTVDEDRRTSLSGVWAGGDCVDGGLDLTVSAVQDGKIAAESIHRHLSQGG